MHMTKLVLAAIGAAAACGASVAETYYVDQKHPQAADTNSGTREAPLRTVSAAAARTAGRLAGAPHPRRAGSCT